MSPGAVIRRHVARVLLFDPRNRLLLFFLHDATDPMRRGWWYPPGGGMDPGETPEQAARRELLEEAGIENVELGPVVLRQHGVRFRFDGHDYEQDEWHLVGRLPNDIIGTGRVADVEAAAVAAHRWWTVDDFATTPDVVYPRGLAWIVEQLLRDGPPAVPWELDP